MGTLDSWEFYETFGGFPEPDEAFIGPDRADDARDQAKDLGFVDGHGHGCHCNQCWDGDRDWRLDR